jgi:hypothetical protein
VSELQAALKKLGYTDPDTAGTFGPGTKDAVKALYARLGYDPATTGGVGDTGDQSTLQADAQAVSSAEHTVTLAKEALSADRAAKPVRAATVSSDEQTLGWDEQALTAAKQQQATEIADTGYDLPLGEFVFVPSFPATLASINGDVGATVSAPLVTIDTGRLVISGTLQQSDEQLLKVGMKVSIYSEVLNKSATGTLSAIGAYSDGSPNSSSASSGSGSASSADGSAGSGQGSPGYPVTVTPEGTLDSTAWLGQNVRLTITAASTGAKVLAVPVAAITTNAAGATSVLLDDATTGQETSVPVSVGVTAAGMCAITPADPGSIHPGDTVVTGQ